MLHIYCDEDLVIICLFYWQAIKVIASFKELQIYGEPVVVLATNLYKRLSDPENWNSILHVLSNAEASAFQKFAGPLASSFTLHNPTGHYVLDLSRPSEKEIAQRLATWKNQETAFEEQWQKEKSQLGFPKINFDRVWRNATLNSRQHTYSTTTGIPSTGKLELDFVQISKPEPGARAIDDSELDKLITERFRDGQTHEEEPALLVRYFRELSNIYFFAVRQVQNILVDITKAFCLQSAKPTENVMNRWQIRRLATAFIFWRFENRKPKRFVRLICLVNDIFASDLYQLRVEVIVIAFARTVDWYGLAPMILDHLSLNENEMLEQRLGRYNLFNKVTAVGSYSLDLANREHQRVMQVRNHCRCTNILAVLFIARFQDSIFISPRRHVMRRFYAGARKIGRS